MIGKAFRSFIYPDCQIIIMLATILYLSFRISRHMVNINSIIKIIYTIVYAKLLKVLASLL